MILDYIPEKKIIMTRMIKINFFLIDVNPIILSLNFKIKYERNLKRSNVHRASNHQMYPFEPLADQWEITQFVNLSNGQ